MVMISRAVIPITLLPPYSTYLGNGGKWPKSHNQNDSSGTAIYYRTRWRYKRRSWRPCRLWSWHSPHQVQAPVPPLYSCPLVYPYCRRSGVATTLTDRDNKRKHRGRRGYTHIKYSHVVIIWSLAGSLLLLCLIEITTHQSRPYMHRHCWLDSYMHSYTLASQCLLAIMIKWTYRPTATITMDCYRTPYNPFPERSLQSTSTGTLQQLLYSIGCCGSFR